ncbi:hypothetical protein BFW01_g5751 [Lasiodiplodia theobromae]|nr:hypothetical protein BFW01_g5751 [Lasiodiplodia theobromae]
MTAQPHTSGPGAQDVELANVASPTTAEAGPSNSTANLQEYDYLDDDRAAGVYRPRSTESSEPPPAYVLKPPPYTAKDPALAKPLPPWKQWVVDHRKWLMLASVILAAAIVVATIYGIMKARAQGIVNALQFERGANTTLDLTIFTGITFDVTARFDWSDALWNNDSQYKYLNFDEFRSLTFTLEGATEQFTKVYDVWLLIWQPKVFQSIEGLLYDDELSVEVFKRMINQKEFFVWIEGSTKVKIDTYLPKYRVHFKKKIMMPGFGGISRYDIFWPEMWNLSDPEQIERDGTRYPRFFNFQGYTAGGLIAGPNTPQVEQGRNYYDSSSGLTLKVDIYENGTETRLGQGNLTNFLLPYPYKPQLTAMIDVDYADIEEMAKAYEDGMMPWVLRPTGALMPKYDSPVYYAVTEGDDAPWFFEVVRGMEFSMVVNVTQGMRFMRCPNGEYDDSGTCVPYNFSSYNW